MTCHISVFCHPGDIAEQGFEQIKARSQQADFYKIVTAIQTGEMRWNLTSRDEAGIGLVHY